MYYFLLILFHFMVITPLPKSVYELTCSKINRSASKRNYSVALYRLCSATELE